jgi:predicted aspartyl protease
MKTRITQIVLAAFLIAILIGGNVSAKGTELVIVSGLENVVEPELEVEDWMVNENNWNTFNNNTYILTDYSEASLEVEKWMLDQSNWLNESFLYSTTEAENVLMLEGWMVNEVYWN